MPFLQAMKELQLPSRESLLDTLQQLPAQWEAAPIPARIALLAILPIVYVLVDGFVSWYRLRAFPGPFLAKFTYLWIFRTMWAAKLEDSLAELQEKYGPIVRIGPNDLLVGDGDEITRISGARSSWGRSGWYKNMRFDFENDSVITILGTKAHDKRKAQLQRGYEGRGLVDIESVIDAQLETLIHLLRTKYAADGGKRVVNFTAMTRYFSMDVVSAAATGEPWGDLRTDSDNFSFFEVGDALIPFMHCIAMWSALRDVTSSRWFLNLFGPKITDNSGLGKFMGIAREEVAKRVSGKVVDQKDWITEWLKSGLSPRDVESDAILAVVAGADTASTPVRTITLFLVSAPYVYNKVKAELAAAIKAGAVSKPVRFAEAQKLTYLQAAINEGLRVLPTTMTGFGKRAPPEGDTVCGMRVPGGVTVHPNNRAILLDKKVFGDDVHVFRPERWLECGADRRAAMRNSIDLIFSKGRWQCPGRLMALAQINKVLVEILRNFDIQVVNAPKPFRVRSYSSILIEDFKIRVTENPLD